MTHSDDSPSAPFDDVVAPSTEGHPPRTGLLLALIFAVALVPRVLLFNQNENLHGDAVVRTELAERWAADPHWIVSAKDGAYQFGPLHLYLVGAALKLGVHREDAGRAVSLLFGLLTLFPLYFLTRRLFGWKSAVWASLGLAVWGLHLQLSTTGASEALALFLILTVLSLFASGWETGKVAPLLWSAIALNFACATRYDAWLLVPLLSALLFFAGKDRVASTTRAVLFGFFCLPFPLLWMHGNALQTGRALEPIWQIEQYHRVWAAAGGGDLGDVGPLATRLLSLLFWPGTAVVTLGPLAALLGGVGAYAAFRRRPDARWLVWVMLVPTLYFTFRAAVLGNFVPLSRFAVGQVALLLPFMAVGFQALFSARPPKVRAALLWGTAALTLLVPVATGYLSVAMGTTRAAQALAPVSPVSKNSEALHAAAKLLANVPPGEAVILDADDAFQDIQLAFYSGLPDERLVRARWDDFDARRARLQPAWLVRFRDGRLSRHPELETGFGNVRLGDAWFEPAGEGAKDIAVYRRVRGKNLRGEDEADAGLNAQPSRPGQSLPVDEGQPRPVGTN